MYNLKSMKIEATEKIIKKDKEERDITWEFLATVDELKKKGQLTKWIKDHDILLYEYEGEIKAISNVCRHFGGPVGFHKAKNGVFTCLWHNWQFSCKDGSCITHPSLPLRQYDLKIIDGKIYINLLG